MSSVVNYKYGKEWIKDINEWTFGVNWPIVYIIYNERKAYIGETLNAVRRTEQHLQEPEFDGFTHICLISDKTYNKSVILDLESFLIKYMCADGAKELTNGNAGVVDHNYFYREAYEDDFKEIWNKLIELKIVQRSLDDIENSELYKYSPYKTLNDEQHKAVFEIMRRIRQLNKASIHSMIAVLGGAGTGKTILAVYLVKLLVDITREKNVWVTIDDSEEALYIQKFGKEIGGIKKIGFVVPMNKLRTTMKVIFDSIDGLNASMVLSPEDVVKERYDILIVDEAHRLYRRKHLPGAHLYKKFDSINRVLMGDALTRTEEDLTELDWIIKSSRLQILFYDQYQTIRVTDIGPERFIRICTPYLEKPTIQLFSQMRCKGGNGYYEYIKGILEKSNMGVDQYRNIMNYEIKVFDHISELFSAINEKNRKCSLSRIVTGPGWNMEEPIIIENHQYHWAKDNQDCENFVYSIHKVQGFDLNYAGVIFGKEIYFNENLGRVAINKKEVRDNFTKSNGDEDMQRYIINIYITLMTRGINGTFVYAMDKKLSTYLRGFLH